MRFGQEGKDEGEGLVIGHWEGGRGRFGEVLLGVDLNGGKKSLVPSKLMSWRFVWTALSCSTTADDFPDQLLDDGVDVSYNSHVRSFVVVEFLGFDVHTKPFDFASR